MFPRIHDAPLLYGPLRITAKMLTIITVLPTEIRLIQMLTFEEKELQFSESMTQVSSILLSV